MQRLSNPCGLEDTKKTQQLNLTQELVLDRSPFYFDIHIIVKSVHYMPLAK